MNQDYMPKHNAQWFKNLLQSQRITQRKLASALRLDPSGVSLLLRGKRRMQVDEATEIAKILSVPLEDVLANAGVDLEMAETKSDIQITGWFDVDLVLHNQPPKGHPKKAPAPMPGLKDLRVARIQSAGSSFEGMDGAIVYYRANRSVDADSIGKLCVVKIQGVGQLRLRYVKKGYRSGTYNLFYPNGQGGEENVVLETSTPVIWMKL